MTGCQRHRLLFHTCGFSLEQFLLKRKWTYILQRFSVSLLEKEIIQNAIFMRIIVNIICSAPIVDSI